MTVTPITSRSVEQTQPIKVVRELRWNNPHPFDENCLFVDYRSVMTACVNVSGDGAHEYLSVRIGLPGGGHFLLALTGSAESELIQKMIDAHAKWDAPRDESKSEAG